MPTWRMFSIWLWLTFANCLKKKFWALGPSLRGPFKDSYYMKNVSLKMVFGGLTWMMVIDGTGFLAHIFSMFDTFVMIGGIGGFEIAWKWGNGHLWTPTLAQRAFGGHFVSTKPKSWRTWTTFLLMWIGNPSPRVFFIVYWCTIEVFILFYSCKLEDVPFPPWIWFLD